jgi:hypothetical protein
MFAHSFILTCLLAAALVTLSGCGDRVDRTMYSQFQRTQEAFDQARQPHDFLRVAAQYQEILDTGLISGAVLYNQGNAFMRAGERGRAVACYRQAVRYRPRDARLTENLNFALRHTSTKQPRKSLVLYVLFWQDFVSHSEKVFIDTMAGVLTFALALAGMFWRPKLMNRMAIAVFLLTFVLGVSVAYDWYRFDIVKRGVVVKDGAVARKGDAESYAPAFTKALPEGSEFRFLENRGDWILIELPGQHQGWIRINQVVIY